MNLMLHQVCIENIKVPAKQSYKLIILIFKADITHFTSSENEGRTTSFLDTNDDIFSKLKQWLLKA